ncbi:hypothetical protein [Janibacter sp. DB-40]|uniref:hypothetical protein n=1 Tax=Janibacter sp. DB-40 TaxID=3028808 RepID=UPI002404B0D2|nr:hypothetical protein [Janibacter sp. DB-40]
MTRTGHRPRTGAAIAVAALVGTTALSACSSDAPSDGWKQLEGERVTVEYPQEWTKGEGSGEKWVLAAETDGAGIQVADPFDDSRTAAGAIGSLQFPATMKLDGYQPGEGRDITVEGADTALLQTFTYEDGGETAQGAWIIASQRQPSASVAVTIGGTEVDKALISHVVDTLRYQHSDEPVPDANEQS